MKRKILMIVAAGLLAGPLAASAGPVLTPVGGDAYQVTFDPISFTVVTAGEVSAVVFEDFYSSVAPSCGASQSGTVQTSVNGGAIQGLAGNACTGAYDALGDVDGNDLLVTIYESFLSAFGNVSVGDTVQMSSLDYVFTLPGLNPSANAGPFDAFLVDNHFARISDVVPTSPSLPEPGTIALFGLGVVGFGLGTRRKNR